MNDKNKYMNEKERYTERTITVFAFVVEEFLSKSFIVLCEQY